MIPSVTIEFIKPDRESLHLLMSEMIGGMIMVYNSKATQNQMSTFYRAIFEQTYQNVRREYLTLFSKEDLKYLITEIKNMMLPMIPDIDSLLDSLELE